MSKHQDDHQISQLIADVAELSRSNKEQFTKIMPAIQTFATAVQAQFVTISNDITGLVTDITALNAKITAFNNSPGTLSPTDQAALDAIGASAASLVTQANAAVPLPLPPTPAS